MSKTKISLIYINILYHLLFHVVSMFCVFYDPIAGEPISLVFPRSVCQNWITTPLKMAGNQEP